MACINRDKMLQKERLQAAFNMFDAVFIYTLYWI
jgi:hypothetical protein